MPALFILLFKINLVLAVFAAGYYFVLRKLTFYVLNRAFLMFGILFSSAYPFINLSGLSGRYDNIASIVPAVNQNISEYIKQDNFAAYWQAASVVFWAGAFVLACRLVMQFVSLYRIHKSSKPGRATDYKVRIMSDDIGPFSFWQTIYVNPKLHSQTDLDNILKHEKVHVEEWHTLDILLAEMSLVFYWFNPGVWLMKRAVRENIEFITDAKILREGINKKTYQYSLLHAGNLVPALAISNNFSLSDLRKRIKMMNAKRSSPIALSRYVIILPVLLITTLAFTITKKSRIKDVIFSEPVRIANEIPKHQEEQIKNRKKAKNTRNTAVIAPQKDSLKRSFIIEAFDTDSTTISARMDEQHLPKPGERIKMIMVRRNSADGGVGEAFSTLDTTGISPKKVFILHRKGDETLPPDIVDIKHRIALGKPVDLETSPATAAKFFLNGKEITEEEFKKIDMVARDSAPAKKLMIRVERKQN
ncbi:MAG: M56 family metallopeptidase [Bacteroidota bacterium]